MTKPKRKRIKATTMIPLTCKHCGRVFFAPDETFEYCSEPCRILGNSHWEGDCLVYDGSDFTRLYKSEKYGVTKTRRLPVYQIIYEHTFKVRLKAHEHVEHTCGNPKCVNVKHLRLVEG